MKVTPKQLKVFIDQIKINNLKMGWGCEVFEAMAFDAPRCIRSQMKADSEKLMKHGRKQRKRVNKAIENLQEILKEDELLNSWKGEDRYIEI